MQFIRKRLIDKIIVFALLLLVSCKMYDIITLVSKSELIKNKNLENLENIISLIQRFSLKDCVFYKIKTSNTTDAFFVDNSYYNGRFIVSDGSLRVSDSDKQIIQDNLPKKHITGFTFVKNAYISFRFSHLRDMEREYAKLIYFYNKDVFKKLFPTYTFYDKDEIDNIDEKKDWVYFYDDHWAITTSDDMSKLSKEICKEIIK